MSIGIIPTELYRGDSDLFGIRSLRQTIHHGQLQTNLVSGGVGKDIVNFDIEKLVNKHVAVGWRQTHFLSFTSDLSMAFNYGAGLTEINQVARLDFYNECFDHTIGYDFALITFDTTKVIWQEIAGGVYKGQYRPSLAAFAHLEYYSLILIDVHSMLSSFKNENFSEALKNSARDKEWIVLPATAKEFNYGVIEFSAILDGACLSYRMFNK